MMRPPLLVLLTALAGPVASQTIHVVGGGGLANIQAAIQVAAPGDVIVVRSGIYPPFQLDRGLTVTAEPGAVVQVASQTISTTSTDFLIPAGQRAHVVGLKLRNLAVFGFIMTVRVSGGVVHFSDCLFEMASFGNAPGLSLTGSQVVMHRCVVLGGSLPGIASGQSGPGIDGLVVANSRLAATASVFAGGHLNWDFLGVAGHGLRAANSEIHLSHCVAIGGNNHPFNPGAPPGHGVFVQAGSSVWLADCLVLGGHSHGGAGATALVNQSAIAVQLARTSLGGGGGATPGTASSGPVVTAPLLGAVAGGPLARGQVWQATFTAAAGVPIIALASPALAPAADPRALQPVWSPAGAPVGFLGVTNAAGRATFATAVPNHPALQHATSWLHGFAGAQLPVQVAPPLGGVVR